jgi:hypothetical protein
MQPVESPSVLDLGAGQEKEVKLLADVGTVIKVD